ncbi:MAG: hypothetical protein MKZ95_15585 [Pirellulales bacterium]|nr:hypothetical protein [Pirellulales bacterium]
MVARKIERLAKLQEEMSAETTAGSPPESSAGPQTATAPESENALRR